MSEETTNKTCEIEGLQEKLEDLTSQGLEMEKDIKTLKTRLSDNDEEYQMKLVHLLVTLGYYATLVTFDMLARDNW